MGSERSCRCFCPLLYAAEVACMYIIKRDASACADMCERKVVQEGQPHTQYEMNNRVW